MTASATVTVAPAPCATGADSLTFKGKEVNWKITNGTDTKLTIDEITIGSTSPWPSANGALDQVKLNGDVIAGDKVDFPCCSADITTFDKDANKRSLDHNKSKTLKFKFRNKPAGSATGYQVEVRFTNGCAINFPLSQGGRAAYQMGRGWPVGHRPASPGRPALSSDDRP